jgi:predicted metal-dependent phosphoesterase TrpH
LDGSLIVLDIDLHCHSTCSDGTLQPADLIRRAASRGVDVLALTDHDTLDGLAQARDTAACTLFLALKFL